MKVNSPAPKFILKNSQDDPISLSEILDGGQHVLLVFLRHLG